MEIRLIQDINEIKKIVKVNKPTVTLSEEDVWDIFRISGALQRGHWELLSEMHSDVFLKFREIVQQSSNGFIRRIGEELAERFKDTQIDVVLAPITAGCVLADAIATRLGKPIAIVEKGPDGRPSPHRLRRGFVINENARVLIVNDMTTTGTGITNLINIVKENKGEVVGIALFASRNREVVEQLRKEVDNIQFLVELVVEQFQPSDCPLCQKGDPLEYSFKHSK